MSGTPCGNPICDWDDRHFGRVFAICRKTGAIDRVIQGFKYAATPSRGWQVILGRLVLGWLEENVASDDYDLVVSNPTHKDRPVRHTELILEAAEREDVMDAWSFAPDALAKTVETTKSATGTWRQKWEAAQELRTAVIATDPTMFEGKRVLIFDDITTTCAQFHVLAGMLKGYGAVSVDGLVIARTIRPQRA
jgi:predicted amidophosphoribosyltransferase